MKKTFEERKKTTNQPQAKQYFDLLVFMICILYVVTVTLTKCNQPADWLIFRREVLTQDCISCLIHFHLIVLLRFSFWARFPLWQSRAIGPLLWQYYVSVRFFFFCLCFISDICEQYCFRIHTNQFQFSRRQMTPVYWLVDSWIFLSRPSLVSLRQKKMTKDWPKEIVNISLLSLKIWHCFGIASIQSNHRATHLNLIETAAKKKKGKKKKAL